MIDIRYLVVFNGCFTERQLMQTLLQQEYCLICNVWQCLKDIFLPSLYKFHQHLTHENFPHEILTHKNNIEKTLALHHRETILNDILFMVNGQKKYFKTWQENLVLVSKGVSLVYASFDEKILEEHRSYINKNNDSNDAFDCHTMYIPNTTSTEARNFLAEKAIRLERMNKREFNYWVFSDDDVTLDCNKRKEMVIKLYGNNTSCWQLVVDFLRSSKVPEKASTVVFEMPTHGTRGFGTVSTVDAMFNAFKRRYVPYLLPYPTLREGKSWHLSQIAIFCVTRICLKSSVLVAPYRTETTESFYSLFHINILARQKKSRYSMSYIFIPQ